MKIGMRIKRYRFLSGITQRELSKRCHISRQYLNKIENNKDTLPIMLLLRISKKGLKICPYDILDFCSTCSGDYYKCFKRHYMK